MQQKFTIRKTYEPFIRLGRKASPMPLEKSYEELLKAQTAPSFSGTPNMRDTQIPCHGDSLQSKLDYVYFKLRTEVQMRHSRQKNVDYS